MGDAVNTTARLASLAAAGEILVTTEAAAAAGLDPRLERRSLDLKGKQHPTDVVSLRVGRTADGPPNSVDQRGLVAVERPFVALDSVAPRPSG